MKKEINIVQSIHDCRILLALGRFFLNKKESKTRQDDLQIALQCAKEILIIGETNKEGECYQNGYRLFLDINEALSK